ncbi:MAG: hypothetical protein ACRDXX_00670 [Stackebrandtia sp.]
MGRTLGPYTDVSTTRVEGAYEIYQAEDDEGREVEILTLGASSSKDPARRALLSDTVGWAHATRGPADAPILTADLNAEQPYVVTQRVPGVRGVERMLERMLAMGPPTGPLPAATGATTGQIPVVGRHTDPHGIPRVTSTPPSGSPVTPASPMTPYVTQAQRSRPPWLLPTVIALTLVIVTAGGLFIYYGLSGGPESDTAADDDKSHAGDAEETPDDSEGQTPQLETPEWQHGLTPQLPDLAAFDDGPAAAEVVEQGWPFAFRVGEDYICEVHLEAVDGTTICEIPDGDSAVQIELGECAQTCTEEEREDWEDEADLESPQEVDADTLFERYDMEGVTEFSVVRYFSPRFNAEKFTGQLMLRVTAFSQLPVDEDLEAAVNDVVTQASS